MIARTSSFSFKGEDTPIAEIARDAARGLVPEGSVRKSGEARAHHRAVDPRQRQLAPVVARPTTARWTDIFKVQDDIAAAVVDKLRITLLGAVPTAEARRPEGLPSILQAGAVRSANGGGRLNASHRALSTGAGGRAERGACVRAGLARVHFEPERSWRAPGE